MNDSDKESLLILEAIFPYKVTVLLAQKISNLKGCVTWKLTKISSIYMTIYVINKVVSTDTAE